MRSTDSAILEVRELRTYLFTRRGVVKAVDGVSFSLGEGQTLGLVGESGCGKTMTCLSLVRLLPWPAGRIMGGEVLLDGEDLLKKPEREMTRIRGQKISMILQDPMTSLNPVFSIGNQLTEAISAHQHLSRKSLWSKAQEMLGLMQIASPELRLRNYPHEMSGGMKQRVVGAVALSCQPRVLIADEPTTALDVTTQAQYLALLKDIQQRLGFSLIFVTHDFGIVARMCDWVGVMYAGKMLELAPVQRLFAHPCHPYTNALMTCVPRVDRKVERLPSIEGEPPDLHDLPPGCTFSSRCPNKDERCHDDCPPQVNMEDSHWVSCWHYT